MAFPSNPLLAAAGTRTRDTPLGGHYVSTHCVQPATGGYTGAIQEGITGGYVTLDAPSDYVLGQYVSQATSSSRQ